MYSTNVKLSSVAISVNAAKICIIGLGHVGCVLAACLSSEGHDVVGVDRDLSKIMSIRDGRSPFYEPDLAQLIETAVSENKLRVTTDVAEGLHAAGAVFVCVGTPSNPDGSVNTDHLVDAVKEVCDNVPCERSILLVIRSTLFPCACEHLLLPILAERCPTISLLYVPEFLRQGSAIRDFFAPPLLVVGCDDTEVANAFLNVLGPGTLAPIVTSFRQAEMIKYACNSFHALKVTFANEIDALCRSFDIDGTSTMGILGRDNVLNISTAYLRPGFAFGGSCLGKDLRAIEAESTRIGLALPLLSSIRKSNRQHVSLCVESILERKDARRIAFFGLSYKEDTDDLRESAALSVIGGLEDAQKTVRVFDPRLNEILQDTAFAENGAVHGSLGFDAIVFEFADLLEWADLLVVTQRPTDAYVHLIRRSKIAIVDLSHSIEF